MNAAASGVMGLSWNVSSSPVARLVRRERCGQPEGVHSAGKGRFHEMEEVLMELCEATIEMALSSGWIIGLRYHPRR